MTSIHMSDAARVFLSWKYWVFTLGIGLAAGAIAYALMMAGAPLPVVFIAGMLYAWTISLLEDKTGWGYKVLRPDTEENYEWEG